MESDYLPSVYLSFGLSVCLSVYLSVCLTVSVKSLNLIQMMIFRHDGVGTILSLKGQKSRLQGLQMGGRVCGIFLTNEKMQSVELAKSAVNSTN